MGRGASEKPYMMDGKLLQTISWGDKTMFLLALYSPLPPNPHPHMHWTSSCHVWHGSTIVVTVFPQDWHLCWPLFLLTCCGKAPSVLGASQHPSGPPCFSSQEPEGKKSKTTFLCKTPEPLLHPPYGRLHKSPCKTSTVSHQEHIFPRHC